MRPYLGLRCSLPPDREDELSEILSGWPVLGAEFAPGDDGLVTATVYLRPGHAAQLEGLSWSLERWGATVLDRPLVEPRDWLEGYRRRARPFAVGRRWWVDPGLDGNVAPPAGRIRLVIEPRSAFGSGSHESTRLVLQSLEDIELSGMAVLDVGTGSGILALAAERLGAREVVALDIDDAAIWVARSTARQQDRPAAIGFIAGPVACLAHRRFDLALCNMVSSSFLPLASDLRRLLVDHGRALFSGILGVESEAVSCELARAGFSVASTSRLEEWVCLDAAPGP